MEFGDFLDFTLFCLPMYAYNLHLIFELCRPKFLWLQNWLTLKKLIPVAFFCILDAFRHRIVRAQWEWIDDWYDNLWRSRLGDGFIMLLI